MSVTRNVRALDYAAEFLLDGRAHLPRNIEKSAARVSVKRNVRALDCAANFVLEALLIDL